jgi:hypothetical protein
MAILNLLGVANRASFSTGAAYGIFVNGPQNCSISNNEIASNLGSIGIGLVDTTVDTNNFISGNLSLLNTTMAYEVQHTIGSFPVVFAMPENFNNIQNISRYLNVAIEN